MPYMTFSPSVLTAAQMNDYLMKQAVISCTSGTRPSSPVEGMTIYETDTNCYVTFDGSAWVHDLGGTWRSYTPTLSGGITLGSGLLTAKWARVGKTIFGRIRLEAGGTTTFGGTAVVLGLPVATTASNSGIDVIGNGWIDNGTGTTRRLANAATPAGGTASTINLLYEGGTVTGTVPIAFGTSMRLTMSLMYEGA